MELQHTLFSGIQQKPGVHYLYKPKQGTWSQPNLIEGTRLSETAWTSNATLACDSQGSVLLAYHSNSKIYTARKPAGDSWALPTPVVDAKPGGPELALAGSGTGLLAWVDASCWRIRSSSLLPDGSWSAIEYLSGPDHACHYVRVAGDASGTTYAVSVRVSNPEDTGHRSLVLRWKTPDNPWSPEYLVYEAADEFVSLYPVVVDSTRNIHFFISDHGAGVPGTYRYLTVALGEVMR
jgi:hypothetical protein